MSEELPTTVFLVANTYERDGIFPNSAKWPIVKAIPDDPFPAYEHRTAHGRFLVIVSGVGKANAAAAAAHVLVAIKPQKVVNIGLAGSMGSAKAVRGELRRITSCLFHDVDVTLFGGEPLQLPGRKSALYELVVEADEAAPLARLATGDIGVGNHEDVAVAKELFDHDMLDMEGAAIAHVFEIYGRLHDLAMYKAASDYADASAGDDYAGPQAERALQNLAAKAAHIMGE